VRDTLDPMAREQQLALLLELPSDDRDRLGLPRAITSVLVTLALRALRKMSSGSVEVGAQIMESDQNLVAFWVRDSGPSITLKELPALFEPFSPARTDAPRDFSELGSGLFISSQLVAEMGGELTVRPNPDEGSLFSFTLSLPPLPRRA
jgi:signal transduction histidine kinase